jgi:hypothetical protein
MSAVNYNGSAPSITFKTVLVWAFGVLLGGFSLLLLVAFYDFITLYASALSSAFLVAFRVLLCFFVAYIGFMLFLSFEYKAIQNERFKRDNVELLQGNVTSNKRLGDDKEMEILSAYSELMESGAFSLNRLALAVYGKKGGVYNSQLREVLQAHDIDV